MRPRPSRPPHGPRSSRISFAGLLLLLPVVLAGQVKLTGFAEGSYTHSNHSSGDSIVVGRLYDRFRNQFMLNAVAVVLDKPYDAAKVSAAKSEVQGHA